QLGPVDLNERQAFRELRAYGDVTLHCLTVRELYYLADRIIDFHALHSQRRLFDKITYSVDDIANSTTIFCDPLESLPGFVHVWRLAREPPQPCIAVAGHRGDRLIDLMGD